MKYHSRDGAQYVESGNITNATSTLFTDPSTYDLTLVSEGTLVTRHNDVLLEYVDPRVSTTPVQRNPMTDVGADQHADLIIMPIDLLDNSGSPQEFNGRVANKYESSQPKGTPFSPDPTSLPLADLAAMEGAFIGAFKAPFGAEGQNKMAFNPAGNGGQGSIYLTGGGDGRTLSVGEISVVPDGSLLTSTNVADISSLPTATQIQAPVDIFSDIPDKVPSGEQGSVNDDTYGKQLKWTGLQVIDGKLVAGLITFYVDVDPKETHVQMRIDNPSDFTNPQIVGVYNMEGNNHAAGWMAPIPTEWQATLGGDYLSGWDTRNAILNRLSMGPSMFTMNSSDILAATNGDSNVPTTARMDFPFSFADDTNLWTGNGNISNAVIGQNNDMWTQLCSVGLGFIVPGTRTYALLGLAQGFRQNLNGSNEQVSRLDPGVTNPTFGWTRDTHQAEVDYHFGSHGFGTLHYKRPNTQGYDSGGPDCWDVDDRHYQYWFFDMNDILGAANTYSPRPYARGPWNGAYARSTVTGGPGYDVSPGGVANVSLGPDGYTSGTLDPATNRLYLCSGNTLINSNDPTISGEAVIHVYQL